MSTVHTQCHPLESKPVSFWFVLVVPIFFAKTFCYYGAFTLDVKSMLNENLDGILDGTQMGNTLMLSEC